MSPAVAKAWSLKQVDDRQLVNKSSANNIGAGEDRERSDHRWKPPGQSQFKINVDASVVGGQNSFGIGMVLRNHQGQFLTGKTMRFAGSVSVIEAESTGVLEALIWS